MIGANYISIAEFADRAGVSKQAIYKQVNNENSQIIPYIQRTGKKTLINELALTELYGVDIEKSTPKETPVLDKVEETTPQTTPNNPKEQPIKPEPTPEIQPDTTQYIAFLMAQIQDLQTEKREAEQRLNATIEEKDRIIKEQSAQLAQLAQQMALIADKALIATSQQQYLTAIDKNEKQDKEPLEHDIKPVEPKKKGFWAKWFSKW